MCFSSAVSLLFRSLRSSTGGESLFACRMDLDFIERIERIRLTSEEGEAITLRPIQQARTLEEHLLSIIGKFLTSRPLNQKATKDLLRSVWKLGNDLKMVVVGEGLIQFKFAMESQLRWVMNNGVLTIKL